MPLYLAIIIFVGAVFGLGIRHGRGAFWRW